MCSKIIVEQSTYYLYPLYGFANTIVRSVTSNTHPRENVSVYALGQIAGAY